MSNTKDENGVVRIATTTSQANNSVDRRKTLKKLGIGGVLVTGAKWTTPVVMAVTLPVHAQTSSTTTTSAPGTTTTSPPGGTTTPLPGTTTTTTTTLAPMCNVCSASIDLVQNDRGGFIFDGSNCSFLPGISGLISPDRIFTYADLSSGLELQANPGSNWATGFGGSTVGGPFGEPPTKSFLITVVSTTTSNQYTIEFDASRSIIPTDFEANITISCVTGPL